MSRLIDILQKIDQAATQPMGFGANRQAPSTSRIMLIASLEPGATTDLTGYADGADALLLRLSRSQLAGQTLEKMVAPLKAIPWGVYLEDSSDKQTETLLSAGCDFVVFPAASPVTTAPRNDKVGKILQVESSMDDSLLRAINRLPVDAVYAADVLEGIDSLVWHQLMIFQHLTNLITKPLIVPASSNITEAELKALWEAGVDGVVVETKGGDPLYLKELRETINNLPARSARKGSNAEALLPRSGVTTEAEPEEEEEDWE